MHSSTSSSDDNVLAFGERVPHLPWLRIWAMAIVLLVIFCAGAEMGWRSAGHRPSIVDDPQWWAYHRNRIYDVGEKSIVLAGDSRLQLGISTDTMRSLLPDHTVTQLALDAHGSYEMLRDLAADVRFNGVVICSAKYDGSLGVSDMSEYLAAAGDHANLNDQLNRRMATWVQDRFVLVNPSVQTLSVLQGLWKNFCLPEPYYVTTHFDRSRSADYSMVLQVDLDRSKRHGIDALPDSYWEEKRKTWSKCVADCEEWARQIQERGGEVVVLCMPCEAGYLEKTERETPKAQYWDVFARSTRAVAVNFMDVPELKCFKCPDGSHLDCRDTPAFTQALVAELEKRGVLPRGEDKSTHSPDLARH